MTWYYISNVKSDDGYHPLSIAISGGDNLIVESILGNFKSMITPSLLMKATEQASKDGHADIVANLTKFNKTEYNNLYASNIPIMNAARKKHFKVNLGCFFLLILYILHNVKNQLNELPSHFSGCILAHRCLMTILWSQKSLKSAEIGV